MSVAGKKPFATAEDDDITSADYIWVLVPQGIAIVYIVWLGYLSNRDRRERLLNWRRSNTRGAKLFRVMFPRLDWDPLYFPKDPHSWKDLLGVAGILTVLIMMSVSIGLWGDNRAWMQSRNPTPVVQILTLAEILFILLGPVHVPQYWPKALTKELIEALYRPQIDRLREIATHIRCDMGELDQSGQGIDANENDLKLFSIPSIFLAVVEPRSPDAPRPVGDPSSYSLAPHAPRIVATSHPTPRSPQMPDGETALIPGWVKFGDSSRRSAVIYAGAIIDDAGERREFRLFLNIKILLTQISKANVSSLLGPVTGWT